MSAVQKNGKRPEKSLTDFASKLSASGSKATVRCLFEINHISSFRACGFRKPDKLLVAGKSGISYVQTDVIIFAFIHDKKTMRYYNGNVMSTIFDPTTPYWLRRTSVRLLIAPFARHKENSVLGLAMNRGAYVSEN